MTTSPIEAAECDSCTVATDNHSGLCDFCAEYNPPTAAQLWDALSEQRDLLARLGAGSTPAIVTSPEFFGHDVSDGP